MPRPFDKADNWEELRSRIIGMGEQSSRKSYYPELRSRLRELEETKKSLAEVNVFLQAVMDACTEAAIVATTPDGTITLFNRGAERLLGYHPEEVVGTATPLLFHLHDEIDGHADDLRAAYGITVSGFRTIVERADRQGSEQREWSYRHKDGHLLTVQLAVTPIRDDGQTTGYLGIATDISRQKETERAVRASESSYRRLHESMQDAYARVDMHGVIVESNQAFQRLLGYGPEELAALTYEQITPERWHAGEAVIIASQVLVQGFSETYEKEYRRRDGTLFPVEVRTFLLRDDDGTPLGMWAIVRDITERKLAEEKLRLSEQKYVSIFQLMPDMVGITRTADGTFIEVNPGFERWTGWTKDEVLGRSSLDLGLWTPETRGRAIAILKERGRLENFEFFLGTKSGEQRHAVMYLSPITIQEESCLYFMARDISAQKQAEAELRLHADELAALNALTRTVSLSLSENQIIDAALTGMQNASLADAVLIFLRSNGDLRLAGVTPDSVRASLGTMGQHRAGECLCGMAQTLKKAVYSRNIHDDIRCTMEECKRAGLRSFASLPLFGGEDIIGVVGLASFEERDFEAHSEFLETLSSAVAVGLQNARLFASTRAAEENVRQLNERLEQRVRERTFQLETANKELESFSYSVSHDLRAPLRHMAGYSRLLLDEHQTRLDDDAIGYLEKIELNSNKMGRLIDSLLQLSRISRTELRLQQVDLSALAREVVAELREQPPERSVQVEIADGMAIQADPVLIRLVLQNLLANAWKYTRHANPAVISVTAHEENGRRHISVGDNGAGFDMNYAGKLFGAFQRLHSDQEFEGTGIGLATVQRIVHRHGGEISAEGKLGKGAVFTFTLDPLGGHRCRQGWRDAMVSR